MKCIILTLIGGLFTFASTFSQSRPQQRFPLSEVRLLQSPFLDAEKTDLNYMLKLEPDRLLAPFLREAGLPAKAKSYGNWESMGLDGHTAGHYLTALAQMYASTGNQECKARLDYMVSELARCQRQLGNGYIGGIPGGLEMWQQFAKGNFELFYKKWVPWYNLHKVFAGLRDAYEIAGNVEAKMVLVKLTGWCYNILSQLSERQIESILNTEQGGMNEVCADVAALTGESKYLGLAKRFSQKKLLRQLEDKQDSLTGLHANTQIPKVIGFERIAQLSPADTGYDNAARFFWNTVVKHRTISFGGNSVYEHFNPTDDFSSMIESVQGPETCNSYNMLKLTESLFLSKPAGYYMDYYERCLYNHILSSERIGKGGFVYFTPIRPREYRVYSSPEKDFWCCVGTGMENHGKYGEMIYTHQGADIFVNLFIPSRLNWEKRGLILTQNTQFPYKDQSNLTLQLKKSATFSIYVRKPGWLKSDIIVKVNGKKVDFVNNDNSYVEIRNKWQNGDQLTVELPMRDRFVGLPDGSDWVSIEHGPIVLAAVTDTTGLVKPDGDGSRFDHIASGPLYDLANSPILKIDNQTNLNNSLIPVRGRTLTFTIPSLIAQGKFKDLQLKPFFQIHDSRYMVYWPVAAPGTVEKRKATLAEQDREVIRMSRKTIDHIAPGEQQPEVDHSLDSHYSQSGVFKGKHWRNATNGYFNYTLKMMPDAKYLTVTYCEEDQASDFEVYLEGKKIANVELEGNGNAKFFTVDYLVPDKLKVLSSVTVKFVANKNRATARVFDIRLTK